MFAVCLSSHSLFTPAATAKFLPVLLCLLNLVNKVAAKLQFNFPTFGGRRRESAQRGGVQSRLTCTVSQQERVKGPRGAAANPRSGSTTVSAFKQQQQRLNSSSGNKEHLLHQDNFSHTLICTPPLSPPLHPFLPPPDGIFFL